MSPSLKKIIAVIVVLLIAASIVVFFNGREASDQPKWNTAKADLGPVIQRVTANGTVNPVELVNVGTQISGTVVRLHVDFNQRVKEGQLLAELDPSILEAQIRQTEASLASATANLNNAELVLKRNESLREKGFVADSALDGLRRDVTTARAQVAQVQAQLSRDKTNLSYSMIRSPISGTVVNRGIDVGQTVAASFQTPTLFQIARDLRKMQINTSVPEADVGVIKPGQPVRFTVDAFRDRDFKAKVQMVRLNPVSQQNVVTYNVVITVDNEDGSLLPGMTAQVSIETNRQDSVLRVPATALRFRPPATTTSAAANTANTNGATTEPAKNGSPAAGRPRAAAGAARVYLLQADGSFLERPVEIGVSDGRFTQILDGLAEGEEVVTRAASANTAPQQTSGFRFRMF